MGCKVVLGLAIALAGCPAPAMPTSPSGLARIEASVDLDGKPVGHADRPTLVVMFASWCPHCRAELREIAALRVAHPELRVVGIDYWAQEGFDHRGSPDALRTFVATTVPWLEVVQADDALYAALGSPPHLPTTFVFDAAGAPVTRLDGAQSRRSLERALGY